jgi:DICT domain-containing protein
VSANFSLYQKLTNTYGDKLNAQLQRKTTLITLSHALENTVLQNRLEPVILTAFQSARFYQIEKGRYARLKETAKAVLLYGEGLSDEALPIQDWFLVISEPRFKALLACAEFSSSLKMEDAVNESQRTFHSVWSCDAEVVDFACQLLTDLDNRADEKLKANIKSVLTAAPRPLEQTQLMRSVSENILQELESTHHKTLHQISHNRQLLQKLENQQDLLTEVANAKAEVEGKLRHLHQELFHLYDDVTRSQTIITNLMVEKTQQEQKKAASFALLEQLKAELAANLDDPTRLEQINRLIVQLQQNL